MLEFFAKLFDTQFMPHRICIGRSEILWLHVITDALIALAYYSIPLTLVYFVRKRRDLAFHWMFLMFGLFIAACGTTHVLNIWTLWTPFYRLEGMVKAITAGASVVTAIVLVPLIPRALALPSPEVLRQLNEALAQEVEDRKQAETKVRELNAELERRVKERTAELQRSNEDLQQFAYIASHDLQEPLRMVASFTQLLSHRYHGKLDQEADEYIQFAVDGAQRMQKLIGDLLSYARLETGDRVFSPVNMNQVVAEAEENLRHSIQECGAEIQVEPLPWVLGDRTKLAQLCQNLLANAIKYRGDQPPRIRVRADRQGRQARFSVEDNGIGIEPEYHEQIFTMFKRLHGPEQQGTGIGLAVCKRIVLRHGGEIGVESAEGRGATFWFTLPVAEVESGYAGTFAPASWGGSRN